LATWPKAIARKQQLYSRRYSAFNIPMNAYSILVQFYLAIAIKEAAPTPTKKRQRSQSLRPVTTLRNSLLATTSFHAAVSLCMTSRARRTLLFAAVPADETARFVILVQRFSFHLRAGSVSSYRPTIGGQRFTHSAMRFVRSIRGILRSNHSSQKMFEDLMLFSASGTDAAIRNETGNA